LVQNLAAGTYYVAVSGSGNRDYHPLIAGSGTPGSTGPYGLLIKAQDLGLVPGDGPHLLASNPAAGSSLPASPFVLRLELSGVLDPSTVAPGQDVQLLRNARGTFGDGTDQSVPLAVFNVSAASQELQLTPAAPLALGFYEVILAGEGRPGNPVLRDQAGKAVGQDASHPFGQVYTVGFAVTGIEGNQAAGAMADDTPATAHELGNLAPQGALRIAGAIGDDPTDPVAFDPSDVDLYHFRLTGAGHFALSAAALAGRLDSPLDPALSLFEKDPVDGSPHLVWFNDDTENATRAHDGSACPLFHDAALMAGLTQGDYYLVVSSAGNMPDPGLGLLPGTNGIFDPLVSHSGQGGTTTGWYVLNVAVQPDNTVPHVVALTLADGTRVTNGLVLDRPPTGFNIAFDAPTLLPQLFLQSFVDTHVNGSTAAYVQGDDGSVHLLRAAYFSPDDSFASFYLYDALPNGNYTLHLSGPAGLTDPGGNPLAGNSPNGDYTVSFSIQAAPRGTPGNPIRWSDHEPNDTPAQAQDLGTLFPAELSQEVRIVRDFTATPGQAPADSADYFQFAVLQRKEYTFTLSVMSAPGALQISFTSATGASMPVRAAEVPGGFEFQIVLDPGAYQVRISGWTPAQAARVDYQLGIAIAQAMEPPPPLTTGPGPAIQFRPLTSNLASLAGPPLPVAVAPRLPGAPPVVTVSAMESGPATVVSVAASTSDLREIPTSVLLALGAPPVAGVGASAGATAAQAPDVHDRILAASSGPQAHGERSGAASAQTSGTAEKAASGDGLAALVGVLLRKLDRASWLRAVELLYHLKAQPEKQVRLAEPDGEEVEDASSTTDAPPDRSLEQSLAQLGAVIAGALTLGLPDPGAEARRRMTRTPLVPEGPAADGGE
jgi:hypothetical protein